MYTRTLRKTRDLPPGKAKCQTLLRSKRLSGYRVDKIRSPAIASFHCSVYIVEFSNRVLVCNRLVANRVYFAKSEFPLQWTFQLLTFCSNRDRIKTIDCDN